MIDAVFNACVVFLLALAQVLGTTYETVNVWIFCIIEPIMFVALVGIIVRQKRQIEKLNELNATKNLLASNGCGMKPLHIRRNEAQFSICGDS